MTNEMKKDTNLSKNQDWHSTVLSPRAGDRRTAAKQSVAPRTQEPSLETAQLYSQARYQWYCWFDT